LPSHLDLRRMGAGRASTQGPEVRVGRGKLHWLFVSVGWLLVVAAAFTLGYLLAEHDSERLLARIQMLQAERDEFSEQAAVLRDARMKLERSHQIDVEAQRAAQEQILKVEQDRMRLEQQLTHLRAMVGAGDKGVVEVDSLVLTPQHDGWYRYRLTLSQLVPHFGRSKGEVVLSVVTNSDEGRSVTPLAELGADSAGRHEISFDHFQVLEGRFRPSEGVVPVDLIVEIVPKDDTLLPSKEVVGWREALSAQPAAPAPSQRAEPGAQDARPHQ